MSHPPSLLCPSCFPSPNLSNHNFQFRLPDGSLSHRVVISVQVPRFDFSSINSSFSPFLPVLFFPFFILTLESPGVDKR